MNNLKEITAQQFEAEVLKSDIPVLVDFWADWCGPCKAIAPVLDDVAEGYKGKIKFVKVNVDDCEDIARQYGVMMIPTLKIFKNGEVVSESSGVRLRSAIAEMLDKVL